MKLKLLLVCVILLSSAAEARKVKKQGAPLGTTLRGLGQLFNHFKERTEEMFSSAKPFFNKLAEDNPVIAHHFENITETISDSNFSSFYEMSHFLSAVLVDFMQPIMGNDSCVTMPKNKVALMPQLSKVDVIIIEKLIKINEMLQNLPNLFELVWNRLRRVTEKTSYEGEKCKMRDPLDLVFCLYDAIIQFKTETETLSEDSDIMKEFTNIQEIAREIVSVNFSLSSVIESLLRGIWTSSAFCKNPLN